ncbi:C4-type zinc ribbon domain-containing protein [Phytomonospora sp. NPDC050363]|uniref:zinc ribbon domain-containing protein n=1 Tax=Phytomonospora sp. NPDC050363 TaxID=3155642 RepID=UPI00340689BA
MKADPKEQRRLLDLQLTDTTLNQLDHRRRNLPEHAEIARLDAEARTAVDEHAQAEAAVGDIDRDIARQEREIDQVRQRAARDQSRLDAGTGTAKDLANLQHELGSLARRQSELEDVELELMERRETAQAAVDALTARLEEVNSVRAAATERRDKALEEIGNEEALAKGAREKQVGELSDALLALYDKIRRQSPIAAAPIRGRRCGACRIELSAGEVDRVQKAPRDEVLRCEECRSIMVRTEESGL